MPFMKQPTFILLSISLIITVSSVAQFKKKDMKLDSAFQTKADRLEVKMGWQVSGKLWNYKFGEYHLTANKIYGNKQNETTNFWGTKSTIISKHRFYFELSDDQQHANKVEGSIQNDLTALNGLPLSNHLYIGEIGIAKSGYVVSRCGWFSDRSASYLASGRPVVAQDTGFSNFLPTGEGLLAFNDEDDAVAAVDAIGRDYSRHARAARHLAETYFDSDTVLATLLEQSVS